MKKTTESRIFSRRKARMLDIEELNKVSGSTKPVETHCFCPGAGMDDCDSIDLG